MSWEYEPMTDGQRRAISRLLFSLSPALISKDEHIRKLENDVDNGVFNITKGEASHIINSLHSCVVYGRERYDSEDIRKLFPRYFK